MRKSAISAWNLVWSVPYYTGVSRFLHERRATRDALILMYHGVTAREPDRHERRYFPEFHMRLALFEQQMQLIRETCLPLSLRDLVAMLREGVQPPPNAACITFDDAYENVVEFAVPVLDRLAIPATIFACAGGTVSGEELWVDELYRGVMGWPENTITVQVGRAAVSGTARSVRDRRLLWSRLCEACAALPVDEINRVLEFLGTQADVGPDLGEARVATAATLRSLRSDLFDVGSHTVSHASLPNLSAAEAEAEMRDSREQLQAALGRTVDLLAYPFGRYSEAVAKAARDCGYVACVTTRYGANGADADLYALKRPAGTWPIPTFAARAWGLEGAARGCLRG